MHKAIVACKCTQIDDSLSYACVLGFDAVESYINFETHDVQMLF